MKAEELSVLLIEDEATERNILRLVLGSAGIRDVDDAINEFQAINKSRSKDHHLVISDTYDANNRPYGPDAVERIKWLGKKPVVVGISNYSGAAEAWRGLADYFFDKLHFREGLQKVLKEKFDIG